MPDELKGSRSYHEALRRMGVQNPGEVPVGTPAQLQVIADDVSHLSAPLRVPVVWGGVITAAVAAEFSGVCLHPRGNCAGIWIEQLQWHNGASMRAAVSAAPLGGTLVYTCVDADMTIFNGPRNTEVLEYSLAAINQRWGRMGGFNGSVLQGMPFWVPNGVYFYLVGTTANSQQQLGYVFREVPLRSPETIQD